MRRWLAILVLGSLMNAQAATLACPMGHHAEAKSHQHAPASGSQAALPPATGHLIDTPHSHDGNDGQCLMATACTAVTLCQSAAIRLPVLPEIDLQPLASLNSLNTPYARCLTPPPKSV